MATNEKCQNCYLLLLRLTRQSRSYEFRNLSFSDPMTSRLAPKSPKMGKQMNFYPGYGDTNNNYPRDTYVITKERLDEIRREKLYPFFDRDEDGGRGDFVPELNDNSVQVQKQLNFLLPFFGFGFNYTWVSRNIFQIIVSCCDAN